MTHLADERNKAIESLSNVLESTKNVVRERDQTIVEFK